METTAFDLALNFHGIGSPQRPLETGEEAYWISENFFQGILSLVASIERKVLITFDDSNSSDIEIAAPLLLASGITAIFFILTGRLDTPGSLTTADVLKLRDMGMKIGSHGHDQVDWTLLNPAQRKTQLQGSKMALEAILGEPIDSIAITYGKYNRSVLRDLRKAGYSHFYTSDGGPLRATSGLMPRTSVKSSMSLSDIEKTLRGEEAMAQTLRRKLSMSKKAWL